MSLNAISFPVIQAANVAAQWHSDQRRKGARQEPYVNHLLEVAALVAAGGGDQDTIIAALLHDAIEDQEISREIIAEQFSDHVAEIVLEVSDDKSLPWQERKADRHCGPQEPCREADQAGPTRSARAVGRGESAGRMVTTAEAGLHRILHRSRQRSAGYIGRSGS
jgi:(p)ppGpp synthase/HD superfamily hydrolase